MDADQPINWPSSKHWSKSQKMSKNMLFCRASKTPKMTKKWVIFGPLFDSFLESIFVHFGCMCKSRYSSGCISSVQKRCLKIGQKMTSKMGPKYPIFWKTCSTLRPKSKQKPGFLLNSKPFKNRVDSQVDGFWAKLRPKSNVLDPKNGVHFFQKGVTKWPQKWPIFGWF